MKIHEYQAVDLFREYGINTVPGELAEKEDDAFNITERLGGKVVVKAQVLLGGRGKAGGVKLACSPDEAGKIAGGILSMRIKSEPVKKVLIAKALDIQQEYYLGVTLDRGEKKIAFMISAAGGIEIEELAQKSPDKIYKSYADPMNGPEEANLKDIAQKAFKNADFSQKCCDTLLKMYKLFVEKDCSLVEINPYVRTKQNSFFAADAKINFDDSGIFKHPDIEKLRNSDEYSRDEMSAKEAGLSFVSMDGDIGCVVNGAGLAMATMDVIKLTGGEAANFLDVGGSSNPNKVLSAIRIILSNKKVRAILINIFGGITRCDDIANGIVKAAKEMDIKVPLIIRLVGTNETQGRDILKKEGFVIAEEMTEAVKRVVRAI